MTERLSDEQVANVLNLDTGWVVADDVVKALALEVQQARLKLRTLRLVDRYDVVGTSDYDGWVTLDREPDPAGPHMDATEVLAIVGGE